jgi:PhnB protein
MITINPYLNFNGNTEEAFNFYKSVFGGEFSNMQRFKDMSQGDKMSLTDKEKIMHIALPIGQGTVLMATDALESLGQTLTIGDNFSLIITPESEEEAHKLFDALSVDGKITMPLEKSFRGAYFGMLTDRFGIQWMVNIPKQEM